MSTHIKKAASFVWVKASALPRRLLEMLRLAGLMSARRMSERVKVSLGMLRILWEAAGCSKPAPA